MNASTDTTNEIITGGKHVAAPHGAAFHIRTMDCAAEESEIRRTLESVAGIESLSFQLGARTLAIVAPEEVIETALLRIRSAGFDPQLLPTDPDPQQKNAELLPNGLWRLVAALVLAAVAEGLSFYNGGGNIALKAFEMAMAAMAIGLAGLQTYKKGLIAFLRGQLNINALMTIAVTGAFLIGQWPEAAMVMALYAIAELIEARSLDRARNAIKSLMALTPAYADVRQADGLWTSLLAADVPLGAVVRIRPGARVPLDGVVTVGASSINQAPVTGESMPVDKAIGDAVFAGTINQTGELEFRVTAAASNTTLARIIDAVEKAQATRAPTQRFVDRFAAIYTPAVFFIAIAVAVLMPWLMGWTLLQGVYKALVLLVIACPCALVLSTPVTIVSALTFSAKRGILIKGGTYLEQARLIKAIALDKTGTITSGKPTLVEFVAVDENDGISRLGIAAGLATRSDHPVSRAIAEGLKLEGVAISDFTALAGRGVQGTAQGKRFILGNHRFIEERGLCTPAIEAQLSVYELAGFTVTLLASDFAVLAVFAVADSIKPSSRLAISELVAMSIAPVMLTGDNQATASAIARDAGISDARGDLLPEAKLAAIDVLQRRYGVTAMTGDGINDSPALARADIGIAMGAAGTDIAMETADVVVMNDDLRRIPELVRLSRRTHTVLWQNIALALGIKTVFLLWAVFGTATMWMAVFADMGASLLVVGNGLRLLKANVAGDGDRP